MTRVFLSLGSNLDDRLAYLRSAVRALGRGPSLGLAGASKVYETVPVEVGGGQPDYLNCVVEVRCGLPAVELLRYCQGVEAGLGRERKGERAPRTVDIDVLLFGDEVVERPDFGVPHRGSGVRSTSSASRTSTPTCIFRAAARWPGCWRPPT